MSVYLEVQTHGIEFFVQILHVSNCGCSLYRGRKMFYCPLCIFTVSGVLWTGCFLFWIQFLTRRQINLDIWTDCKLGKRMFHFCSQYSSLLLVIMSVEKCFALYFPLQSKRFCTVGIAKKISSILALILFAFNAQFFFIYDAENKPDGAKRCVWVGVSDCYKQTYAQIDSFLYSLIPLSTMLAVNCLIIIKFVIAKWKNRHGGSTSVNQALSKSAVKGTVMLLTVSFAFIILTGPISLTYLITDAPPIMVHAVTVTIQYLNHSINGVLYSIVRRASRR